MPLIELATVGLHPSLSSSPSPLPSSFSELWTKCLDIASSASGIPFQLYHSSSSAAASDGAQIFYLLGGWQTTDDHIAFLSTPQAVDLAKAIGQFMTVDIVRHIDGDIAALLGGAGADTSDRPQRLVVTTYKVPTASANIDSSTWKGHWEKKTKDGAGAGGWDESAAVQKQHQAFKQMGQVTNSASAFGGNDSSSDMKTWVWIEDATRKQVDSSDSRLLENASKVEADSVEIEYFIG
jgi:hypothetical protein